MASSPPPPHFLIFPFMAQGHTLPLLDLSLSLSRRRVKVTVVTTPANAASISAYLSSDHHHPTISVAVLPFSAADGVENTSLLPSIASYVPFLLSTARLRPPFLDLLARMSAAGALPTCVVSDFFLGWTSDACARFKVPRLVFHGMGVATMAICKAVCAHAPHKKCASELDALDLPGVELPFALTAADLPEMLVEAVDGGGGAFFEFMREAGEGEVNSWGVVVNSFLDLEGSHVAALESFYADGARAWCVGPLFLYEKDDVVESKDSVVVEWLDGLEACGDVIYVSFGTQADVSDAQLDEVAYGLEDSGFRFVMVARSPTWSPPEKTKGKGLMATKWVEQQQILSHKAIGGFMSHCGWNSILESLSAGVPILAWPMIAEQSLNAKFVVDGLEVGLRIVERVKSSEVVSRETICEAVRELMGGDKGKKVRERAQEFGKMAKRAVQDNGSSAQTLDNLIAQLCATN